jgi:hypothetical protein
MSETELMKVTPGELATTAEGDLRSLLGNLAQQLSAGASKHHDDITCELDVACDNLGSRARLRFRSYRRQPAAAA